LQFIPRPVTPSFTFNPQPLLDSENPGAAVTFTPPDRKLRSSFLSPYHNSPSLRTRQKTMQPNRKARRAQERQAIKYRAEELRQRQRGSRQKVPRRPPFSIQPNITSLFGPHYGRLVDTANKCIDWLCIAKTMLLRCITMTITILIMFFSAPVDSKVSRKSRSQKLSAARGISKRHTKTTSEDVGEDSSVQRVEQFHEMSRL
jgi:hypothetical protein